MTDTVHADEKPQGRLTTGHPGGAGLRNVPLAISPLNRKDFTSDQEVRWCPGCGDYAILSAFQAMMPQLGLRRENTVIVSGIGCAARFPYYVDCFGMHSIHGRAPAIATGLATSRPDLNVWVVSGDGDSLSIGGNHLIHALRRNVNLTILLFNNRIYGLTKGQYSPTSEAGKVTKSSPFGSVDHPFNAVSLALGAEASFVARTIDSDRTHLTSVLLAAAEHRGASLVEIYQNCPIFNDGAFDGLKGPEGEQHVLQLEHGKPMTFAGGTRGIVRDPRTGSLTAVDVNADNADQVLMHDAHREDPALAFELSRLTDSGVMHHAPVGIFRSVSRPAYDDEVREQLSLATPRPADGAVAGPPSDHRLADLIAGRDTWDVR